MKPSHRYLSCSLVLGCLLQAPLVHAQGASVVLGDTAPETVINPGVTHNLNLLYIADPFASSYTLQGGGSLNATRIDVGRTGRGRLLQESGTVNATSFNLGWQAVGIYNQNAGTNTVSDVLYMGSYDSGDGRYNLNAGTLSTRELRVGNGGIGTFTQTEGLNESSGDIVIAYYGSQGVYYHSGGNVEAGYNLVVGRSGQAAYYQSGNSVVSVGNDLLIGRNYAGSGDYVISSGILAVADDLSVGVYGAGGFFQGETPDPYDIDSIDVRVGGILYLGDDATSASGDYTLNRGTLETYQEQIGDAGRGRFFQDGGSHLVRTSMYIGQESTGVGAYEMGGGDLTVQQNLSVGQFGNGSFVQSTGNTTVEVVGSLLLGDDSPDSVGRYILEGGVLNTGESHVGDQGGGHFSQTGGEHQSAILVIGNQPTGVGTYELDYGLLESDQVIIGGGGKGTFMQRGGQLNVSTFLGIDGADDHFQFEGGRITGNEIVNNGTFTAEIALYDDFLSLNQFINYGVTDLLSANLNIQGPTARFYNDGKLQLDANSTFHISGNIEFTANAYLQLFLAGAGNDGPVVADDQAWLDGTLAVKLGDVVPELDDTFDLLTAPDIFGAFDAFDLPTLSEGLRWEVLYLNDEFGSTDVVRLKVSSVPLPAAAYLFGSGVLLLVATGRKTGRDSRI